MVVAISLVGGIVLTGPTDISAKTCRPVRRCPTPSPTVTVTPSPSPTISPSVSPPPTTSTPPPASGYVTTTVAAGNTSSLPSGTQCASMIHYSTWEPRPDNTWSNNHLVDPVAAHNSLASRPRDGSYNSQWNSWLLPRVDGQFTGTTDEILQWGACKWGLPDNLLRAVAYSESVWFQAEVYPNGRCLPDYGCTDLFSSSSANSVTYCNGLATSGGYDYQKDFGTGICPKTFGIVSVMSWQDPTWGGGVWPGYQNGTFPFNRNSTAFAVDYYGSYIRGCLEGWSYLGTKTTGDLWGCVGSWYSGNWHDAAADNYAATAQNWYNTQPWLTSYFYTQKPSCSATYGCPVGRTG